MNTTQSALTALTQLLIFTLVIERIVAAFELLFAPSPTKPFDNDAPPPVWRWPQAVAAFAMALFFLWYADFDFLGRLLGIGAESTSGQPSGSTKPADTSVFLRRLLTPALGYVVGALVAASGSAGISKIMEAISLAAKASAEKSKAAYELAVLERRRVEALMK